MSDKLECSICKREQKQVLVVLGPNNMVEHICFECFTDIQFDDYVDYEQIADEMEKYLNVKVTIDPFSFTIVRQ